ncbi:MAG: low molecular weight protein-tyrosine-phosphatase [Rhodospirillaceae bacterium]|nr:low molecular weight protein-tyrosine-phosphatase [Rhodospirillaceae bacterium]
MAYRVLFVCTGNICRSPTAEGAFRRAVEAANLAAAIETDSAGTHGYHIGEPPDARSIKHAGQRGIDIANLRARRVREADFDAFDLILAMDREHLAHLRAMRREHHKAEVRLFLDFHSAERHHDVPDPYYGEAPDFEHVLDLVEEASRGLLTALRGKLGA